MGKRPIQTSTRPQVKVPAVCQSTRAMIRKLWAARRVGDNRGKQPLLGPDQIAMVNNNTVNSLTHRLYFPVGRIRHRKSPRRLGPQLDWVLRQTWHLNWHNVSQCYLAVETRLSMKNSATLCLSSSRLCAVCGLGCYRLCCYGVWNTTGPPNMRDWYSSG